MESPWVFHEQKFGILNSNRIPNSELLPLESPWKFYEQKFEIPNSISLFDFFGQIIQNGQWNSKFRTSAHRIAMAIPRAEVRNSEFYWNSKFRTSAHGIAMAIPRAEVQNSEFHCPFGLICQKSQKGIWNSDFRTSALGIAISNDRSLGPKCSVIKLSVSDNLFFYDISKLSNVFG